MIAVEQPRDFIADNEVPVFIAAAIALLATSCQSSTKPALISNIYPYAILGLSMIIPLNLA